MRSGNRGNDVREVRLFKTMDLFRNGIGRFTSGSEGSGKLRNGFAFINAFGDEMYGNARFFFSSGTDRLVDMSAIHPPSAVFREQRGMDVNDALREFGNEVRRDSEEESGKDDVVDVVEQGRYCRLIFGELGAAHHLAGYAVAPGTFKGL